MRRSEQKCRLRSHVYRGGDCGGEDGKKCTAFFKGAGNRISQNSCIWGPGEQKADLGKYDWVKCSEAKE